MTDVGEGWMFVVVWNQIGIGLNLLSASLYGVWFWLRMLERLPLFLDAWETRIERRNTVEHKNEVTRPVGVMFPPSLAFLAGTFWIIFDSVTETSSLTYAIVWPTTIGLMVVSVWWTQRKSPQSPWSDNIALPLSLIIQFGIGFAFLWLESPTTQEATAISVGFSPFALFCLLAVPWFFYFQDIYLWGKQRRGFKSYAIPVYLAGFGTLLLLFLLFWGGGSIWIPMISVVLIIGGVLLAVDQYFSE